MFWMYFRVIASIVVLLVVLAIFLYLVWGRKSLNRSSLWLNAKKFGRVERRKLIIKRYKSLYGSVRNDAKRGSFYYGLGYRDLDDEKLERIYLTLVAWRLFKIKNPNLSVAIDYISHYSKDYEEGSTYKLKPVPSENWSTATRIDLNINWE